MRSTRGCPSNVRDWDVRFQVLEVFSYELSMRSRELSPSLCARALVAWNTFKKEDLSLTLSLLEQIKVSNMSVKNFYCDSSYI